MPVTGDDHSGVIRAGEERELARSLPPDPRSAGEARRAVVAFLSECGADPELVDRAVAIVTELVTNAVLHAATPAGLMVRWDGRGVVVEVTDGSAVRPVPAAERSADGVTGRGLALVDSLGDAWGTVTSRHGKTVWALVGGGEGPPDRPEAAAAPGAATVVLRDVPLDIYRRLIGHEQAMMRELELLAIGSASGPVDASKGSDVSSALRDLLHRARGGFVAVMEPFRHALDGAVDGGVVDLELHLAPSMPAAVTRYADLLARAEEALVDNLFMTTPLDDEAIRLRQWIVDEVSQQMLSRRPPQPFPAGAGRAS